MIAARKAEVFLACARPLEQSQVIAAVASVCTCRPEQDWWLRGELAQLDAKIAPMRLGLVGNLVLLHATADLSNAAAGDRHGLLCAWLGTFASYAGLSYVT